MKQQLERSLGASMSEEIGGVLETMKADFETSFKQLRSRLDEMEKNIINVIKEQQNQEIISLKEQL